MCKNLLSLLTILYVCFHEAHLLTVTLQTSSPIFGQPIELRCNGVGPTCCSTETRTWNRDGTVILTSGQKTARYSESFDSTGQYFSLIINNLVDEDLNHRYSCLYGFAFTAVPLNLTQNFSFIYPPDEIKCPFNEFQGKRLAGTVKYPKAAPEPTFTATYGNENFTALLVSKSSNYDTYYYSVNLSIDTSSTCGNDITDEKVTLIMNMGTLSIRLCDNKNLCEAGFCGGKNLLFTLIIIVIAIVLLTYVIVQQKLHPHSSGCTRKKMKPFGLFAILSLLCLIAAFIIGVFVVNCLSGTDPYFTFLGLCGLAVPLGITCYRMLKAYLDDSSSKKRQEGGKGRRIILFILMIVSGILSSGLLILYYLYKTWSVKDAPKIVCCVLCVEPDVNHDQDHAEQMELGRNASTSETRSSNSGFSCWRPCKVDQEPVDPSKNRAPPKGKATKTPTNEKDKKQVAVVKPEAKHIKTESREKERLFNDDKDFESNLNKVPQGRPLPSLTQTPRILPVPTRQDALPPINERRLPEPLGDINDTTIEKKKKKKKKKTEDDEL